MNQDDWKAKLALIKDGFLSSLGKTDAAGIEELERGAQRVELDEDTAGLAQRVFDGADRRDLRADVKMQQLQAVQHLDRAQALDGLMVARIAGQVNWVNDSLRLCIVLNGRCIGRSGNHMVSM